MRVIGIDMHRSFAVVAMLEDGAMRSGGRVELVRHQILAFGRTLRPDDELVLEATGNTMAIVRLLRPFVGRIAVANPRQVRAIAHARVKTDEVDAATLAKLHASGFLPEVWQPDEATEGLRRVVAQRARVVAQMTRLKNRVQAVLHANLIPEYRGVLFSGRGRRWLTEQPLAEDEREAVRRHLAELDRLTVDRAAFDQRLAQQARADERVRRLMTINGVHVTVAVSLLAAIGDIARFRSAAKLASYFGLTPRIRQSGNSPAQHGRISKEGRAHARAMLVEAARAAKSTPGPLRAFFRRIAIKRGQPVAAVATARKLAVLVWHLLSQGEDYAWSRPALLAAKLRRAALDAGAPSERGKPGAASAYSFKAVRERERAWIEQAEGAYERFVANWLTAPVRKPGA
jgi:transposase